MKCKYCGGEMILKDTKSYSVSDLGIDKTQVKQLHECTKCGTIKQVDTYSNKDTNDVSSNETWYVNNPKNY